MTDATAPIQRPWLLFVGWTLAGLMWAFSLASLAFIGVFNLLTLPLTGAVTWLLAQRKGSQRGLPGLFATASLPFFYIAYLNRQGPGYVIIHSGTSESHSQESSPFI